MALRLISTEPLRSTAENIGGHEPLTRWLVPLSISIPPVPLPNPPVPQPI